MIEHIWVLERRNKIRVPVTDIIYLKAGDKYVEIKTSEKAYLTEQSLKQLEPGLAGFIRVNRNCLVAKQHVSGFVRHKKPRTQPYWEMVVDGVDETFRVARRQQHIVKEIGHT